jgi:hypothetical protein
MSKQKLDFEGKILTAIDEEISKLVKIEEGYTDHALYKAQAKITFLTSIKSIIKN